MSAYLPPNLLDRAGLDAKAAEIATNLAQLIIAARNATNKNGEEDEDLLKGVKQMTDAIKGNIKLIYIYEKFYDNYRIIKCF